jgi:hypothetical protein
LDYVIYHCKCNYHIAQLFNLIEIIDYNKGKRIRQKEYFVEYLICQA